MQEPLFIEQRLSTLAKQTIPLTCPKSVGINENSPPVTGGLPFMPRLLKSAVHEYCSLSLEVLVTGISARKTHHPDRPIPAAALLRSAVYSVPKSVLLSPGTLWLPQTAVYN